MVILFLVCLSNLGDSRHGRAEMAGVGIGARLAVGEAKLDQAFG